MRLIWNDPSDLFLLNSPIHELSDSLLEKKGLRLFIKRDDMIHPFVSGNKWRKLYGILKEAKRRKLSELQTFGGAYSNHLLATACAGAMQGYKTSAYVRGEKPSVLNDTLFLCLQFGMNLHFISREEYKERGTTASLRAEENTLIIPEGGYCLEGSKGCEDMIDELNQEYDSIFVACGTGTTSAGLAKGLQKKSLRTRLELIPVLKGADYLQEKINALLPTPFPFIFHTEFHGGGYAKADMNLLGWIRNFSTETGIMLDPVYTGKALRGVFSLIEKDYFSRGMKILFIHTGGLMGLFGFKQMSLFRHSSLN